MPRLPPSHRISDLRTKLGWHYCLVCLGRICQHYFRNKRLAWPLCEAVFFCLSAQTNKHTHTFANYAVPLVWGLLRLTPPINGICPTLHTWGKYWRKEGDLLSEASPRGWYWVGIVPIHLNCIRERIYQVDVWHLRYIQGLSNQWRQGFHHIL